MSWPEKGPRRWARPRAVTIHSLTLEEQTGPADYTLRVRCSKGTYVRTLCVMILAEHWVRGCMSGLRRTMAAGFKLEDPLWSRCSRRRRTRPCFWGGHYFATALC